MQKPDKEAGSAGFGCRPFHCPETDHMVLSASTNGVLRLLRMNPNEGGRSVTEEEIRLMVILGRKRERLRPRKGEMIENIF